MQDDWEPKPRARLVVYIDRKRQMSGFYLQLRRFAEATGQSLSQAVTNALEDYFRTNPTEQCTNDGTEHLGCAPSS